MFKRTGRGGMLLWAVLAAAPAAAGSGEFVQVESRPFVESAAKARALLKNQPQQPAPSLSVLSATIAADGTVTTRCESQSSPAYRAWVEELRDATEQER